MCRRVRALLRDEEGSVTAELVVAFPLLLILVFSVVQFALYEHAAHVAEAVAQEALTASRVAGGSNDAGNAAGKNLLGQLGTAVLKGATVTTNRGGTTTTVKVTGDAEAMLPIYHLPVTVTASGVTEVFTPATAANGSGT
jgi:Flp pilus assembly protein TadG